jgi:uncharacterized protein YndB with AHSA1/START domain
VTDGDLRIEHGPTSVSVVGTVAAPRRRLFDLVADPALHPRIDGSGHVRGVVRGPARLGPGARFGMAMRIRLPYRITNRVVAFEEGRCIAWMHLSRSVWRWEFSDVPGGTEVRETFDWGGARAPGVMARFAPGNAVAMRRSVGRLAALAADPAVVPAAGPAAGPAADPGADPAADPGV